MTRGIWISQQIARDMGVIKSGGQCQNGNPGDPGYHDHFHQDLLFESRLPTTNGVISGKRVLLLPKRLAGVRGVAV
jgi:hypothetical protein